MFISELNKKYHYKEENSIFILKEEINIGEIIRIKIKGKENRFRW
jgi:hypothetical protein